MLTEQVLLQLWLVFAVFLRVGPAMAMAPGFGERTVSARVRLVLGLVFSAAIAPVVSPHLPPSPPPPATFAVFAGQQLLVGAFFGFFARAVIYLIELAGAIISQTTTMSQMFAGSAESSSIMGHILTVTALALVFSSPVASRIVELFFYSYALEIPSMAEMYGYFAETASELVNLLFRHAVVLSSGFIALALVYYVFTGFVNKAMPQFMIIFVGVPFVALLSIEVLRRSFGLILTAWQSQALSILAIPLGGTR